MREVYNEEDFSFKLVLDDLMYQLEYIYSMGMHGTLSALSEANE